MNCESCDDPKNSRIAAITGLALTRSCGMAVDISWYTRHLFLDGAFHADQADAELVFQQFADRANAAVAQVIDVVHRADALAQLQQVADGAVEIFRIERALVERGGVLRSRTA